MKTLCIALVLVVSSVYAADRTRVLGNIRGAKAKECFRVIDQDGNPVEGAHFRGAFVLDDWNDRTALEELRNAYKYGAEAKLVYQVVDDECKPVCDATAHVWFRSYGREQDNADWIVRTDSNGVFVVVHRLNEKFSCIVNKAGYYQSRDERSYFDMKANSMDVFSVVSAPESAVEMKGLKRNSYLASATHSTKGVDKNCQVAFRR